MQQCFRQSLFDDGIALWGIIGFVNPISMFKASAIVEYLMMCVRLLFSESLMWFVDVYILLLFCQSILVAVWSASLCILKNLLYWGGASRLRYEDWLIYLWVLIDRVEMLLTHWQVEFEGDEFVVHALIIFNLGLLGRRFLIFLIDIDFLKQVFEVTWLIIWVLPTLVGSMAVQYMLAILKNLFRLQYLASYLLLRHISGAVLLL